jgi:outer membrane protein OmpU
MTKRLNSVFDTRILTVDMGDTGVLTFAGTGGSSVLDAIDDVTPTAGEESWDDVTGADGIVGGTGGANMFHYSNSSLMDGLTVSASYTPSNGATEVESSSDYGVKFTGIDGLTIGAAAGEDNSAADSLDITNLYATYTMDSISVGYQTSESDSEATNADKDFEAIGLSYAVSEDMSVSINSSTIDYEDATQSDQEAMGVSVSYTMGSMSVSANHNTIDNVAGTATADRSGYALTLGFAF